MEDGDGGGGGEVPYCPEGGWDIDWFSTLLHLSFFFLSSYLRVTIKREEIQCTAFKAIEAKKEVKKAGSLHEEVWHEETGRK